MLFNSLTFAIFLPLVFTVYWLLQKSSLRLQNALMLVASYVFYGWWDWRFLSLIFVSSAVDYWVGLHLDRSEEKRKRRALLGISLLMNLGALGFFKYSNFFIGSMTELLTSLGIQANPWSLKVILPVGISFYTFQTLSYTLDIYKRELKPTRDILAFFAFVSFFPQLVAGPIERASALLPQFLKRREFSFLQARDGSRQMLWGFAKKLIVADNLAPLVEDIFSNHAQYDSLTLLIGVFFFALQIYCDFSGYSDIAIGTARLFGFKLMRNFAYPYFSRDIGEFWRRWHISLSTWFRDYVYIPLGGNKFGKARQAINSLITFTVSGLWHGANWTFVFWGFLNGLYLLPQSLKRNRVKRTRIVAEGALLPTLSEAALMGITFLLTLLAWVFFRSESISSSFAYIGGIFCAPYAGCEVQQYLRPLCYGFALLTCEWFRREHQHPLEELKVAKWLRWMIYLILIQLIIQYGSFGEQEFIYFQF